MTQDAVMKEILQEIVALLIKYGVNVEVDSAMLEYDGADMVFRCKDLNREDWERRMFMEAIDRIRGL